MSPDGLVREVVILDESSRDPGFFPGFFGGIGLGVGFGF
jgi:hypothetical protein